MLWVGRPGMDAYTFLLSPARWRFTRALGAKAGANTSGDLVSEAGGTNFGGRPASDLYSPMVT